MAERKKVLYIEGTSGISGDMFVGALLDLGADREVLMKALHSIPAEGFSVEIGRVMKNGIDCTDFRVLLDEAHENHDHDMAYLYGTPRAAAAAAAHTAGSACTGEIQGAQGLHTHEDAEEVIRGGKLPLHCHGAEEMPLAGHIHIHGDGHCCHGHGAHEAHGQGHCCHGHGMHGHGAHEEHGQGHCCHGHGMHDHGAHEGHGQGHGCHGHAGAHSHDHAGHRHLADVEAIIDGTAMTDRARALAKRIFRIVAEAEAKAHRLPIEEVHFHEVGAVDSIADIIAAAVCFDNLGISEVIIPSLSEGRGTVRCQHGILPVPVPAVVNIAEAHGLSLQIMNAEGEFVTPTGAAIAAAIMTSRTLPANFRIEKIGLGAGKRAYTDRPPFLRAMLIASGEEGMKDEVVVLESDIDDSTGETLGYVMERLLSAGARDVHYGPVFMKKNRPAWELTVICGRDEAAKMEEIIFRETTTIGIREIPVQRSILPRKEITVATPYGEAQVKCCTVGDTVKYYPEYEAVKRIAEAEDLPFADVFQMIKEAAENE